jgi:hypothetical protein
MRKTLLLALAALTMRPAIHPWTDAVTLGATSARDDFGAPL